MNAFITRIITGAILIAASVYLFMYAHPIVTAFAALTILTYILIFEYTKLFDYKEPLFWKLIFIYPCIPFLLIIYMSTDYNYRILLLYMALLASSQDSGGYLFGSLFGKHKLAPQISPQKTWEGFVGGYILVLLVMRIILFIQQVPITIYTISIMLTLGFAISVLATTGDLIESYLKRRAGIKDTGTILPGHGGFLDRLDSYLAVIFLFFFLRDYLVTFFNI